MLLIFGLGNKRKTIVEGLPDEIVKQSFNENLESKTIDNNLSEEDRYKILDNLINNFSVDNSKLTNSVERSVIPKEELRKKLATFIKDKVENINEEDKKFIIENFESYVWSYWLLDPLIDGDDDISDIRVLAPDNVRIKKFGRRASTDIKFRDVKSMERFIEHIATKNKASLNDANSQPILTDKDTSSKFILRINISSKHVNSSGMHSMHIRKVAKNKLTLEDLVKLGMLTVNMAIYLKRAVKAGCKFLFSGPGGSGKTTLMNALLEEIPTDRSALVMQEAEELFSDTHPEMNFQKVIPPSADSDVEYNLRSYTKIGLVDDLDWMIMGEIKGGEAYDLVNAVYTGHSAMASVHTENAFEADTKMVHYMRYVMPLEEPECMRMLSSFNIIIFMKDYRCNQIVEIEGYNDSTGKLDKRLIYSFEVREVNGQVLGGFVKSNTSCDKMIGILNYAKFSNG